MYIFVLAHNEVEYAKLAIKSIREYPAMKSFDVILVDNASTDGLREWAEQQDDFSYVYMENGFEPLGSVFNQLLEVFQIDDDVLFMQCCNVLLPGTIERMMDHLQNEGKVGIVGCRRIMNKDANEIAAFLSDKSYKKSLRCMAADSTFFMVGRSALRKMGAFNKDIATLDNLSSDLALKMIEIDMQVICCEDAAVCGLYDSDAELKLRKDHWENDAAILEEKWGMHYFGTDPNPMLIELIDRKADETFTVLEVGCDCGATLLDIKNKFSNVYTIGCDITRNAVNVASHFVDRTFVANIEDEKMDIDPCSVDYVIFGDVLEHLHNPERILRYISTLLKPDGKVIASIPNVMHISVMKQLLAGDFTYTEMGLLDKTHIHLFTFNEIRKMFDRAGYELEHAGSYIISISDADKEIIKTLLTLNSEAKEFMYETFQYNIRARIKTQG